MQAIDSGSSCTQYHMPGIWIVLSNGCGNSTIFRKGLPVALGLSSICSLQVDRKGKGLRRNSKDGKLLASFSSSVPKTKP